MHLLKRFSGLFFGYIEVRHFGGVKYPDSLADLAVLREGQFVLLRRHDSLDGGRRGRVLRELVIVMVGRCRAGLLGLLCSFVLG